MAPMLDEIAETYYYLPRYLRTAPFMQVLRKIIPTVACNVCVIV